jgi:hypothetical protein
MFGCVVAGRIIQTNLQQVDDTHAYFELPNASSINHICVFLLGSSEPFSPSSLHRPLADTRIPQFRSQMATARPSTFSGPAEASSYSACPSRYPSRPLHLT